MGNFRDHKTPLVLVGGNSSIHGFDHNGNEIFWTVIGDVVTSLCLLDYTKDGLNEVNQNNYIYFFWVTLIVFFSSSVGGEC